MPISHTDVTCLVYGITRLAESFPVQAAGEDLLVQAFSVTVEGDEVIDTERARNGSRPDPSTR